MKLFSFKPITLVSIVLLAFASQVWQPFFLGLHHDDWVQFAYFKIDNSPLEYLGDRPAFKFLLSTIAILWDGAPGSLHWFISGINLITATSIYLLIINIQKLFGKTNQLLALVSALLWLIAPWGLAYTLWASAALGNVSLLFFCISMILLLQWWGLNGQKYTLIISCYILYTLSLLTYQSIWFAFIPIFMIMAYAILTSPRVEGWQLRKWISSLFIFFGIQLGFLIHAFQTSSKKIKNFDNLNLVFHNIIIIPDVILQPFALIDMAVLGICVLVLIVLISINSKNAIYVKHGYQRALPFILGVLLSSLVYGMAGYGLSGIGEASRTTVMITFWMAIMVGTIFEPKNNLLSLIISFLILVPIVFAYSRGIEPWLESWRIQKELIEKIKLDRFSTLVEPGDTIYVDIPMQTKGVIIFSAPWDITPAILLSWREIRPDLIRAFPLELYAVPPYPQEMTYLYDNYSHIGELVIDPNWIVRGKRLWFWSPMDGRHQLITKSIKFDHRYVQASLEK